MHSAIVSVLRRYRRERQREEGVSRRLPVEARRGGGAGARGATTAPVVHRRCCFGCCCGGAGLSRITPTWAAASLGETDGEMSPGDASEASGAMSWPDEDARGPSLKRGMPMPFDLSCLNQTKVELGWFAITLLARATGQRQKLGGGFSPTPRTREQDSQDAQYESALLARGSRGRVVGARRVL